jgi:hypothetical protein
MLPLDVLYLSGVRSNHLSYRPGTPNLAAPGAVRYSRPQNVLRQLVRVERWQLPHPIEQHRRLTRRREVALP